MSDILKKGHAFFDACETGKGWEVCKQYCHPDASFSAQADALGEVETVQAYTDWMKGLYTTMPDARYELKFFAADEERHCVAGYGIFHATHTGPGGPVEPTGKKVSADYVYALQFEGDRIRHMTKIWNDGHSFRQVGWA